MALKAIALRLEEELIDAAKREAVANKTSFTDYVRQALRAKIGSIIDQPMVPLHAHGDVPHGTDA